MKKLLFLLFLPLSLFAQTPDATIKTNTNNLIRNSTNVTRANHSLINDQITDSKESRIQPFIAVGTNTYTVTIPYVTSYLFGLTVPVQFLNANSGASTINITGSSGSPLGAKSLKKSVTTDLATGDILANESKVLWYDGTSFQVRNIAGSGGGGGISGLTSGRVTFATSGTTIGDDSNLIWDNTNKNLGVGTTPDTDARIHVNKTSSDAVVRVECGSNSGYSFFQAKNSIGQTVDFGKAGSASGSFGVITSSTAYMYSVDDIAFATPSGKIKFGTGVGVAEKMTLNSSGQLGIGTSSPATSALLDLTSSTLALKLTEATRASITTPVNGMLTVDTNVPYFHNGTGWSPFSFLTNTAANNELMMSNGTNAVPSGVFADATGNLNLGTSLSGSTRTISATGSATNVGLIIDVKSGGSFQVQSSTGGDAIFQGNTGNAIFQSNAGSAAWFRSGPRSGGSTGDVQIYSASVSGGNGSSGNVYLGIGEKSGTGVNGNLSLISLPTVNFQSMQKGMFVGVATAAPTGNPTAGAFFYTDPSTFLPMWRVPGGTTYDLTAGGGGTYYAPTTLVANATDANFTATLNGVHNILDGVASTNRVITIPTGANGDVMKFYNTEDTRVWSFTGATVYLADRVTVVTELLYNVPCHMERIDGRWIITN
jgi:hypothetical protein